MKKIFAITGLFIITMISLYFGGQQDIKLPVSLLPAISKSISSEMSVISCGIQGCSLTENRTITPKVYFTEKNGKTLYCFDSSFN